MLGYILFFWRAIMRTDSPKNSIHYIETVFGKENALKASVRQKLKEDKKEGLNVSPLEGQMLKFFVQSYGLKNIVEIGTLYGYSALWFLDSIPEDGKLYCLERDNNNIAVAKSFVEQTSKSQNVEFLLGEAKDSLKKLEPKGPFDLVFIDANKTGYLEYGKWAIKNVRKGGLIIADNTFLFGHVYGDQSKLDVGTNMVETMCAYNELFANHPDFTSMMIPSLEGLTVSYKI